MFLKLLKLGIVKPYWLFVAVYSLVVLSYVLKVVRVMQNTYCHRVIENSYYHSPYSILLSHVILY